ncbi:RDD family protein [Microbacterium sp. HD4P20]|uniref:RDD family protein n=1 Tax=Microbacterium sp. HD4P20 TaxID=2864874 RepID=UPI001C63FDEB|nr:RDD family protein [Microbacterium sp. HD4P20]MCP2635288.1 RDD family protein [Microbacterium sp. HD4P20]
MIWEIDEETRTIEGLDEHGRPRPEYAASLGLTPAPYGRRALATAIEVGVYVVLLLPMFGALPGILAIATATSRTVVGGGDLVLIIVLAAVSSLLTTAFVIVQLALHGRRGVTLGKAIMGIRSVNVRTLERPGFWRGAVVRALVLWASFVVPLIGPLLVIALSPFFDTERRGRGWADLAGATWFVDVRSGLNPYDAKRMRIARKTVATELADVRSELPSLATPADQSGAMAYIPTSRSSGGVLGAVRGEGAPAGESAAYAPAAVGSDAAAARPQAPVTSAPIASSVPQAPAAVRPPSSGASGWVPPRLLPDGDADAVAPAAAEAAPAPAPARRTTAPAAAAPASPNGDGPPLQTVVVTLDTGEDISVDGLGILIGRDPALVPNGPALRLVAIADPTKSVSKTHLAIVRSGTAVVVIDLGSTNGSALLRDGAERTLGPHEQVALRNGDTIRLGDRHARIRIG